MTIATTNIASTIDFALWYALRSGAADQLVGGGTVTLPLATASVIAGNTFADIALELVCVCVCVFFFAESIPNVGLLGLQGVGH
jgi:hypothetical protein